MGETWSGGEGNKDIKADALSAVASMSAPARSWHMPSNQDAGASVRAMDLKHVG